MNYNRPATFLWDAPTPRLLDVKYHNIQMIPQHQTKIISSNIKGVTEVSKEPVVLCRWGVFQDNLVFLNWVDNVKADVSNLFTLSQFT